jgi:F0F1-type ATP synthase delta subunit
VRLLTMLVNDHLNQVAVCVYTANEISQANKQEISEKIAKIFQKKLNISFEVRESILGGLIVQSNNVTIDVSVNHQIKQFAKIAQNYFA